MVNYAGLKLCFFVKAYKLPIFFTVMSCFFLFAFRRICVIIAAVCIGFLAQLVRATGLHPVGRGFDSLGTHGKQ